MKKLWLCTAAALAIIILISGGTDAVDINRMVFIVGIGVDRSDDQYRFTFYTAVPTGSDTAVSENSVSYESITVDSDSMAAAVRQFERNSSRKISLEHLNCCALGSSMESEDLPIVLDHLLRDPSVRRQCTLLALDCPAEEFFSAKNSGSVSAAAASLLERQNDSDRTGDIMTLGRFRSISESETGYYLYILGLNKSDTQASSSDISAPRQIEIRGLAVYSNGRLTGKLTPAQTELARLFGRQQASGILTTLDEDGHHFHYRITYSRCRRYFEPGQQISGRFDLNVECILVSAEGPETHAPTETELAESLHRQLTELLDISRTYGSAITGLETEARQSSRKWYTEHRDSWYELYRRGQLELTVKCEIEQRSD